MRRRKLPRGAFSQRTLPGVCITVLLLVLLLALVLMFGFVLLFTLLISLLVPQAPSIVVPRFTFVDATMTRAGEPVNLVLNKTLAEVSEELSAAGWRRVGTLSQEEGRLLVDVLEDETPISPRYLDGKVQDLAFQGPNSTLFEREHIRFWRWHNLTLGSVSKDDGITLILSQLTVMHVVSPSIDLSRDQMRLLFPDSCLDAGKPLLYAENGANSWYFTDGERLLVKLPCPRRSFTSFIQHFFFHAVALVARLLGG